MGILNPKGNLYSKVPTNPSPTKTRNPMSPLPQPPPVPGTYLHNYIAVKSTGFSIQILIGIPCNILFKKDSYPLSKRLTLCFFWQMYVRLIGWCFDPWTMVMWWGFFFENLPNNWSIWADGLNNLMGTWGYFQLKFQHTFCHCVSLVHDFPLFHHFFLKNTKDFKTSIWDWDIN